MLNTLLLAVALQIPANVPAEIVGEWRYTSTRATTYWSGDGVYAGHGGGMSDHIVFRKDGTFKENTYISTSMGRGWTSDAFNTVEGKFLIDGDHMKIVAQKGRQHGEDTMLASGRYDRPMPEDVLKRQCKTYKFAVRNENGKRVFVFFLGMNENSEMKYSLIER